MLGARGALGKNMYVPLVTMRLKRYGSDHKPNLVTTNLNYMTL